MKLKPTAPQARRSSRVNFDQRLGPIEYRSPASLTPYINNPRIHPEKQIVKLMASITQRRPNMEMIGHLLKARTWWEELRRGNVRVADIARREGVNDSWVSRMVRLNFLAPSVVEAIVNGSMSEQIGPDLLRQPSLPSTWDAQNRLFGLELN